MLARFFDDKRGDMAEAAIVLPIISLLIAALISVAMAAWTANTANHIAQRAARVASVTQGTAADRSAIAVSTANSLAANFGYGTYTTTVVRGGSQAGDVVIVQVNWAAPNWFRGFAILYPGLLDRDFSGQATAAFRVEGW
ncbi:MAG: pilus assembly protein [Thermoflexales bacterium]|nr:pilus assembly protein [Thermoflexales bacterium]